MTTICYSNSPLPRATLRLVQGGHVRHHVATDTVNHTNANLCVTMIIINNPLPHSLFEVQKNKQQTMIGNPYTYEHQIYSQSDHTVSHVAMIQVDVV